MFTIKLCKQNWVLRWNSSWRFIIEVSKWLIINQLLVKHVRCLKPDNISFRVNWLLLRETSRFCHCYWTKGFGVKFVVWKETRTSPEQKYFVELGNVPIEMKQGKKVCKTTAFRCYHCFSFRFLLLFARRTRSCYKGLLLTAFPCEKQ